MHHFKEFITITIVSNNSYDLCLRPLVWLLLHCQCFILQYCPLRKVLVWRHKFFRVVRRIVSGNLDVISFLFPFLNSKQIASLKNIFEFKRKIFMKGGFILWYNVPVYCFGQKFRIFFSDHFWSHKSSFNIHYFFLTSKHFITFSLRTTLMFFVKVLQILHVNNLNSY